MYIDRREALRYMGYRGQKLDSETERLLEECIDEVLSLSKNSYVYDIFDIERSEEGMYLKGTKLFLKGEAIKGHLSKACKCAVMAVTLGLEVERRIALYTRTELTKGLVFDACAAAAVESLCELVQNEIKNKAESMGFDITARFSPGYGDFPIELQKEIINVLKAYERIGLSVNESSVMIPRKSVTAVIGLQQESCESQSSSCGCCEDIYCKYRKD
jgi:hypothetical protein